MLGEPRRRRLRGRGAGAAGGGGAGGGRQTGRQADRLFLTPLPWHARAGGRTLPGGAALRPGAPGLGESGASYELPAGSPLRGEKAAWAALILIVFSIRAPQTKPGQQRSRRRVGVAEPGPRVRGSGNGRGGTGRLAPGPVCHLAVALGVGPRITGWFLKDRSACAWE